MIVCNKKKCILNWPLPIRTHDLCDTGAVLYQLSCQANWEVVTLWVRNIPVDDEECKWIYVLHIFELRKKLIDHRSCTSHNLSSCEKFRPERDLDPWPLNQCCSHMDTRGGNSGGFLGHFTVVCSVTWPLNASEAGVDLALTKTFLLLPLKYALYNKSSEVCMKKGHIVPRSRKFCCTLF